MTNPMGLKLKLKYVREGPDLISELPPQPVKVVLKGNKTESKLVSIFQLFSHHSGDRF